MLQSNWYGAIRKRLDIGSSLPGSAIAVNPGAWFTDDGLKAVPVKSHFRKVAIRPVGQAISKNTVSRDFPLSAFPAFKLAAMPQYEPIDAGLSFRCSLSDLVDFQWETNGVQASFSLPGEDGRILSVRFNRQCIVRILDEMALSTESDDSPAEGLIPEHFAYRVHQSAFLRMQSEAWKSGWETMAHYQFITGWACLDVLSAAYPTFELRDR